MKRAKTKNDVPRGPHFVVIVYDQESVTIPGDERSRTHPGHGYPEHTDTFDTFEHWVTTDKKEWETKIEEIVATQERRHEKIDFVAFEVNRVASVETKVVIK